MRPVSTRRSVGPLLGALAALAVSCGRAAPPEKAAADARAHFLNHDLKVRYVGAEACRPCHVEKASTAAHTGMGRAFYRLTPRTAVEDFTTRNRFLDARTGVAYRMTERGGRYLMAQYVPGEGGRELHLDEREMTYVIGSGNHSRSYVTEREGRLWQMPVCWYPGGLWDLCPGFDKNNGNFGRKISDSCVFCHNGRMVAGDASGNRFVEPLPMGIGCERCHGPGELHVAKWRGGDAAPSGEADPTIVNPRRLPQDLRIQVCFQCHLGDSKATERGNRLGKSRDDYRPGMPVHDAFVPIAYMSPTRHDFGLSAQGERLMLSACFQKSGGKIECLTCHDPHVTVFRADRPGDAFTAKCLSCHERQACTGPAAARAATSPPDDCVRCHMRKAWADDQRHADFTDHWIRRRIDDEAPDERASLNVGPLLPAEFRKLPSPERAYALGRGMFGLSADHPPGPSKIALLEGTEGAIRKGIQTGFDPAEAWLVMGKAQAALERREDAIASFREALRREPENREAAYQLGIALAAVGAQDKAVAVLEEAAAKHPDDAQILAELGSIHLDARRPAEALAALDKATALAPFDGRYEINRATALQQLGRKADAMAAAESAVTRDPDNVAVWRAYGAVQKAAGNAGLAEDARRRVEDLERRARLYGEDAGPAMAME